MFPCPFKSSRCMKMEIRYSVQDSCFWCSVKMSVLGKKCLLVSLLRSGNISACVGAAGKLFLHTSASKCMSNGALLGGSRKMNCKDSGCLVHIKTAHRQTQSERKGPSYDPPQLSPLHVRQGSVHQRSMFYLSEEK